PKKSKTWSSRAARTPAALASSRTGLRDRSPRSTSISSWGAGSINIVTHQLCRRTVTSLTCLYVRDLVLPGLRHCLWHLCRGPDCAHRFDGALHHSPRSRATLG